MGKKPGKDMPDLFGHYLKHGMCMAGAAVVIYGGYVAGSYLCGFIRGLVG